MPVVTYPEDPDSWSESVTPAEGYWFSGTAGTVARDIFVKVYGEASIRHDGGDPYGAIVFELNEPFNVTDKQNPMITFLHKLGNATEGTCAIYFYNEDRVTRAGREYGTLPNGPFELKEWNIGPGTGWSEDLGFDWSRIKQIVIYTTPCDSFWIDWIYFSWEEPTPELPLLNIKAVNPEGIDIYGKKVSLKRETLENTYDLPFAMRVSKGVWEITAIDEDFIKWADDIPQATRVEDIQNDTYLIAIYERGSTVPPSWLLLLIPVGVAVALKYLSTLT